MKKIDKFFIIPLTCLAWFATSMFILYSVQHNPSSGLNSFYGTVYSVLISIPFSLFATFFQARKSSERDLLNDASSRIAQSFTLLQNINTNLKSIREILNCKNSDNKSSKVQIIEIQDCLSQNINDIRTIYNNHYYLSSIIDFNQSRFAKSHCDKEYCNLIECILNHLHKIYCNNNEMLRKIKDRSISSDDFNVDMINKYICCIQQMIEKMKSEIISKSKSYFRKATKF